MSNNVLQPEDCVDMRDVRSGVDALDDALVELLRQRFAYMDAAARIKPDRGSVRDETRKMEVISRVQAAASRANIPTEPVLSIWETLIEASIAYELEKWTELNPDS